MAATQQSMDALNRANFIRCGRAQYKREVRAREVDMRDLLADPPEVLETAAIFDVLQWLPGMGPKRAHSILKGICNPTLTLGRAGNYTRECLAARLEQVYYGEA